MHRELHRRGRGGGNESLEQGLEMVTGSCSGGQRWTERDKRRGRREDVIRPGHVVSGTATCARRHVSGVDKATRWLYHSEDTRRWIVRIPAVSTICTGYSISIWSRVSVQVPLVVPPLLYVYGVRRLRWYAFQFSRVLSPGKRPLSQDTKSGHRGIRPAFRRSNLAARRSDSRHLA